MGKKKGKYAGKWKPDRSWLWCLLAIPVYIVVMLLAELPSMKIVWKIACSGAALFFSYFWKKDQPLLAKVILVLASLMPWLTMLGCSTRYLLLTQLLLLYVAICALIYWNIKERCSHAAVLVVAIVLFLFVVNAFGRLTYVDSAAEMQNWPVYLACGVLVGVAAGYAVFRGIIYLKDDRTWEKISICIVAAFLGFFFPWMTVNNLNYMLDTSEPVIYELMIDEKEMESHARSATEYYLIVDQNGQQLEMRVSQSEYYRYEVGDKLPVALYEGAFGDAYYIVE